MGEMGHAPTHGKAQVLYRLGQRRCPECDGELYPSGNSCLKCVDCDRVYLVGDIP